jgi:hypothetical protein
LCVRYDEALRGVSSLDETRAGSSRGRPFFSE